MTTYLENLRKPFEGIKDEDLSDADKAYLAALVDAEPFLEEAVREERERCLSVCDKWQHEFNKNLEAYADIEAIGRIKRDIEYGK